MKKCCGPCTGELSAEAFGEIIRQCIQVLEGKSEELEVRLQEQMEQAAEEMLRKAVGKKKIDMNDFNEIENPVNENNSQNDNRTYMDDFSDILSDLEEYKNNKSEKKKKHRRNGK